MEASAEYRRFPGVVGLQQSAPTKKRRVGGEDVCEVLPGMRHAIRIEGGTVGPPSDLCISNQKLNRTF